ncbi:MAG: serine/threonine-protein kinase [Candidatus Eisenbacteria bacterium]
MDLSRIERLRDIVLDAAGLDEPDLTVYLDAACAGDLALREEVVRLLAVDLRAVSDLESRLSSAADGLAASGALAIPECGQSLGPYRLERRLGAGGSGTVFEAFQEAPVRRRVAVKLLHRNRPLSADLARFRAEQQILANLDHPNIAKVHDAGTTDAGMPYFVLELVEGEPITRFVETAALDRDARLDLCLQACRAAEHAHAKGVIHRDLKPSNILVNPTADGPVAKIIDFGIARLRDPDTDESLTMDGLHLGTPEYMSPEQACGRASECDVKSDVHALGNLLQEVLCGKGVYDVGSLTTTNQLRVVAAGRRELATRDDSGRPLPGDLRRIIAAATDPDRDLRYPTAAALAEDIDRFRTHRPLLVRGAGTGYQLRMAAKRHPITAALLAILAAVVFGSLAIVLSLNARERRAAEVARAETAKAETLVGYLSGILQAASPDRMGREVTLVSAFEDATRRAETELHDDPATLSHFLYIVAEVESEIGDYDAALDLLDRSDSARVRNPERKDEDRLHRLLARARVHQRLGQFAASDTLLAEVIASAEGRGDLKHVHALALISKGDVHGTLGECADEASAGAAAMELLEGRPVGHRGKDYYEAVRIRCRGLECIGSVVEARATLRREAAACEEEFGPDHPNTLGILMDLAQKLPPGDRDDKIAIMTRCLAGSRRLLGADHLEVAAAENNLAVELMQYARCAEAEPYMTHAARVWRAQYGRVHPYVAIAENNQGFISYENRDLAAAELHYRESIAIYTEMDPNENTLIKCDLASNLAVCLHEQGRLDAAEEEVRRGLAPVVDEYRQHRTIANAHYTLGSILLAAGRADEAVREFRVADQAIRGWDAPDSGLLALVTNGLGCAQAESDPETAKRLLAESESTLFLQRLPRAQNSEALQRTAALLAANGETERAARYTARAAELGTTIADEER